MCLRECEGLRVFVCVRQITRVCAGIELSLKLRERGVGEDRCLRSEAVEGGMGERDERERWREGG